MPSPLRRLIPSLLLILAAGCSEVPTADLDGTGDLYLTASVGQAACATRTNNTSTKLLECVTLDAVRNHQAALQAIADANDDTRADGTPGHAASVDYVVETLESAGWSVERMPFSYPSTVAELSQLAPVTATYLTGFFTGTGEGEVTGNVIPVDINLTPPRANTSGCEAADFAGIDFSGINDIALMQRGTCDFSDKALNAEDAGSEAVVIFNQGDTPSREDLITGTLGGLNVVDIPVVGASFADGVALAQVGSVARVRVAFITVNSENVIAETPGGDPNNVVVVGAHLDAPSRGPGIQNNGSGSAAILESALQIVKVRPLNKIRFAWWGGSEAGLLGSEEYVGSLSPDELDAIALYLNFDMIGSPNFVRFVSTGNDGSSAGPPGSEAIEDFFVGFYDARGLASEPYPVDGRSDDISFLNVGIPVGGVFTGAEGIKSAAEAAVYGGTAGVQYDPCFRMACDTFDNINLEVLDLNADAVAAATLHFAMGPGMARGGRGPFATLAVPTLDAITR